MDRMQIFLTALVGTVGMFIIAYVEYETYAVARPNPDVVSLVDLEDKGPGDNRHVLISHFRASDNPVIVEGKNQVTGYVPIVSHSAVDGFYAMYTDPAQPADIELMREEIDFEPDHFQYLVQVSCENSSQVNQLLDAKSMQGVLYIASRLFDGNETRYLQKHYPKIDFKDLWVLLLEKEPPAFGTVVGLFGASAICFLIATGALLWPKRHRSATEVS